MKVRLDKWLWAARFYKTRGLATEMIAGGKVHYNEQRCKPSKTVDIGAEITLWQSNVRKTITVIALSDKRSQASIAQELYLETQGSIEKRNAEAEQRRLLAKHHRSEGRPDKKQRRKIIQFKSEQ
ncbi:heat-shock protein [Alginatibacterium sediminis]|uniref:Heat shock protein 15 n=1 Tax=Alginatibacterium sediminis TaxID=2164068 RepID=A0A420E674_9ALTE|nr:S4 domain-containing protein [Alginatibacterium sediminis]RKF13200.1 heat-shock protein [Alginatibacterium sediminis]